MKEQRIGRSAAACVKERRTDGETLEEVRADMREARDGSWEIRLLPEGGVRYTVPETISPKRLKNDKLTVRFRVGGVYKNCYISTYFDEERVAHRKRPIVTPGEMEEVTLTREQLLKSPDLETITIKIEEV